MNSKYLWTVLVTIVLLASISNTAWAEEEKRSPLFSITPALSFAWYPLGLDRRQESTETKYGLSNIGISALMGLKLFDKVGAQLGLKIDDPTFQKLVDFAGYVNIYGAIINFDYHSFGETTTWKGNTPDPIPGGSYHFRSHWTNVSLLYNFPIFRNQGNSYLIALGIAYSNFEMPLEYKVKKGSQLSNPGFGLVKGHAWGLSALMDTLVGSMEASPEARKKPFLSFGDGFSVWIYNDGFFGLYLQKAEIEADALAWMVNANNGASIDGDITRNFTVIYSDDDDNKNNDVGFNFMKMSLILGIQKVWDIGIKARIGLAVGVEWRTENFFTSSDDIAVGFESANLGPVVRFSARW